MIVPNKFANNITILILMLIIWLFLNIENSKAKQLIPNDFIFNECEEISDWESIDNSKIYIDSENKLSRRGSLKILTNSKSANNSYYVSLNKVNQNFVNFENIAFSVYLPNKRSLSTIAIFIMNDNNNFFYNYTDVKDLKAGWNTISVEKNELLAFSKPSFRSIKKIYFKLEAMPKFGPIINIDSIKLNSLNKKSLEIPNKPVFSENQDLSDKKILNDSKINSDTINKFIENNSSNIKENESNINIIKDNTLNKKRLTIPDNCVFSEFQDLSEWTISDDASINLDNLNKFSGSTSLSIKANKVNPKSRYFLKYSKDIEYDFSNFEDLGINIHLPSRKDLDYISILFMTSQEDYYYTNFGEWEMFEGWNNFRCAKSDFYAEGKPSWDNIKRFWVKITSINERLPEINLDKLTINNKGRAKILFTFDDASQSVKDFAFPILKSNDFKATIWANKLLSTSSNPKYEGDYVEKYLSEDTLKDIYANGWDIGNHTVSHDNYLDDLSFSEMKREFLDNQNWLLSLGLERGAYHVCYPMGKYDNEILEFLPTIGVKSGRTTIHGLQASRVENLYTLRTIAVGRDRDINDIKDLINQAVNTGTTIIFMFHEVVPNPDYKKPGDNIMVSVDNFRTISDYIKILSDDDKLDVLTISQWYEAYLKEYPESTPSHYNPN